jgi:proteasome beta subunit
LNKSNQKPLEGAVYHGTTTVGMVCSDGLVLATDTRVTAGGFIAHRRGKKLLQIDNHVAMTIAGVVADAQNVVDTLKYYAHMYRLEKGQPIPVRSAARLVSNVLFSSRLFPYIADVLVGGFDRDGGAVYNVDFFGSLTQEKVVSTGSGSPVAYGVLEAEYKEGLTVARAVPIAAKAIMSAMRRNIATGDNFDIGVIDKNGFREVTEQEKEKFLVQVAGRS